MVWFWCAVANAASYPTEGFNSMLVDTRARVEEVTGRKLSGAPLVVPTVRSYALKYLTAVDPAAAAPGASLIDDIRREDALSWYAPPLKTIYLLDDALARGFSRFDTPDELRVGQLQCVLAHALTHALQDEQGVLRNAVNEVNTAMVEGYAGWVAHTVCAGPAERFSRSVEQLDIMASLDPKNRDEFVHAYGEAFMATYIEHFGQDAAWWRMAQPDTPPRETIETIVRAGIPAGWTDAEPLAGPMVTHLGLDKANADFYPSTPYALIADDVDAGGAPIRSLAGIRAYFRTNTRRAVAMTYLFDSAAGADALVEARRETLQELGVGTLVFTTATFYRGHLGTVLPLMGAARPAGAGATIDYRAKLAGNEWYSEMWAAKGAQVVGVTWEGKDVGTKPAKVIADILALNLRTTLPKIEDDAAALALLTALGPPKP